MAPEKKPNSIFENFYKDYQKVIAEAQQEEEKLQKELKKEESRIRSYIEEKFQELEQTVQEMFSPKIQQDNHGRVIISLHKGYSIVFVLEVTADEKKLSIKLKAFNELSHSIQHLYRRFVLPPQYTNEEYSKFIDVQFKRLLDNSNEFISSFEKNQTLERLRKEVSAP